MYAETCGGYLAGVEEEMSGGATVRVHTVLEITGGRESGALDALGPANEEKVAA